MLTGACRNQPEESDKDKNNNGNISVITSVEIFITPPVLGAAPDTAATTSDTGYTSGVVSWYPDDILFYGNKVYTASVTLTADKNYSFASELIATINNQEANIINNTSNTFTLSYQFAPTNNKIVSSIIIKEQPVILNYTHNDSLDLAGLEITLIYDDTTTQNVELNDFVNYNITTFPVNGASLTHSVNNNNPVAVKYGLLSVDTNILIVNKITPAITFPTASSITYGAALSTSNLTGGSTEFGTFAWVNGEEKPAVLNSGYDAVFTPNDLINYDYTGEDGWNVITGKITRTIAVIVHPALITDADIAIITPAKNAVPETTASGEGNFSISNVTWSPNDNPFLGNKVYTVTVILTAFENHVFDEQISGKINGKDANMIGNTGTTVTLSYVFSETSDRVVEYISIKKQPDNLLYTHGDFLNLLGLEVTLAFSDSTTEDVLFTDFNTWNISTYPSNGAELTRYSHDNTPVVVSYSILKAYTNNLLINRANNTFAIYCANVIFGNPVSPIVISNTGGGAVTYEYKIRNESDNTYTSTVPVNAGNYTVRGTSAETTNYNSSTATADFTIHKANGVGLNSPIVSSITSNSITVQVVNVPGNVQNAEYAISIASNGTGLSAWQTGTTFTSLAANTTYYVYARSAENMNYTAGTPSNASEPITLQTFLINVSTITNPAITVINSGLIIYHAGGPSTGTISVQNTAGNLIEWWYDDYLLGTEAALELNSSDIRYNMIGKKFVTVIVTINNRPYSKRIWFDVRMNSGG
jgi:hypothetical protein